MSEPITPTEDRSKLPFATGAGMSVAGTASRATVRCRDRCGREVADDDVALQAGWSFLAVAGGWRCGTCGAALQAASFVPGTEGETADTLPADSRGALPKETASTIAPPTTRLA